MERKVIKSRKDKIFDILSNGVQNSSNLTNYFFFWFVKVKS